MKTTALFDWFTRLLPLWVILCGISAYLRPALFILFESYMEVALALTMFGIGLVIDYDEFYPLLRKSQMVFLGFFAQFTIMPLLGFLIAKLFHFPPPLYLGSCACGECSRRHGE